MNLLLSSYLRGIENARISNPRVSILNEHVSSIQVNKNISSHAPLDIKTDQQENFCILNLADFEKREASVFWGKTRSGAYARKN